MAAEDWIDFDFEYDWEDDDRPVTCVRCHTRDLQWGTVAGGWRLFDADGHPHSCAKAGLAKLAMVLRMARHA